MAIAIDLRAAAVAPPAQRVPALQAPPGPSLRRVRSVCCGPCLRAVVRVRVANRECERSSRRESESRAQSRVRGEGSGESVTPVSSLTLSSLSLCDQRLRAIDLFAPRVLSFARCRTRSPKCLFLARGVFESPGKRKGEKRMRASASLSLSLYALVVRRATATRASFRVLDLECALAHSPSDSNS